MGKNPTTAELLDRIAELEAQTKSKVSFKVSAKGAVSVYGMGRFPVTLYAGQWERLFENLDSLKKFMADNADNLSRKE